MMMKKRGFSFIEIIIGVCIMTFGLIPLLWALSSGHNQVGITLHQVQASNHAANLLEALRATPFQDLALFPPCMVQMRGGDNQWRRPSEASDVSVIFPEIATQEAPSGSTNVFDKFVTNFFSGDAPIVPQLGKRFQRYFIVIKDNDKTPRYITLIVRVEWEKKNRLDGTGKKVWRHTELRTVLSDPYFCDV